MSTLFTSSQNKDTAYSDITYTPMEIEEVSAERFMDLLANHRSLLKNYWIRPPSLGDSSAPFGTFVVEYRVPNLKALDEQTQLKVDIK